jgi:penicillin-binding protein 1B
VGFDDNRDFKLEGAHSALPIWVEFMKHAHQHREYRNVHPFDAPEGIITVDIDAETGLLATPNCPKVRSQAFISGTQPVDVCRLHGGGRNTQVAGWETTPQPLADRGERVPIVAATPRSSDRPATVRSIPITPAPADPQPEKQRKGFFGHIKDIFR